MTTDSLASIIRYAVKKHKYINTDGLKEYLEGENVEFENHVLNQTAHRLVSKNEIYDAGQSWYSSLKEKYSLNRKPIEDLVDELSNQFALQDFSVWSTRQIRSHYHHLPGKFVTFVYAEDQTEDAVYDFLLRDHSNVYLDPKKDEVEKQFRVEKDTYVVRTVIQGEPKDGHFATIEKILVDLFVERKRLNFIDVSEFKRIFKNIVSQKRINIAQLLSYAKKRNRKDEFKELVEDISDRSKT